jgi:glycosyltransferase involved in cell wall biosynthesis
MPEVTVIIPNYNHSEYLTQRIESVINQSFQDFEIILMDDDSSDNSKEILKRYASHNKVSHIILNSKNSGSTFKQWEKGILLAEGKYIWIAESDDWCAPHLLEYLVEGIRQNPDCVISYCQSYLIDNINAISWVSTHNFLSEIVDGKSFSTDKMLLTNPIFNASMAIWKREFYPMISKEFKEYKLVGDWLFWIELSRLGKVHISGRVLNYFRKHKKNVSSKAFKSGLNFVETLKIVNSLYRRKMISKRDYYKVFKIQFRNYYPVKKNLNPDFRKEIKKLFQAPLTSKVIYYKILLSTIWKQIKKMQWRLLIHG